MDAEFQNKPLTIARRGNPAWVKGMPSPHPGGRPKGVAGLVLAQTMDGAELVAFMVAVMRGTKRVDKKPPSLALRMEAVAWLADHGFGKPVQQFEHTGGDGGPVEVIFRYVNDWRAPDRERADDPER